MLFLPSKFSSTIEYDAMNGEYFSCIEGPRGELGYYIVSDGSVQPFRVRIRPPTFISLQVLRRLVKGHLMADVIAIIGTLDIVLGEIDR